MSRPERTRDPMVTSDVEHPVEATTQCFDRGPASLGYLSTKRLRPSRSKRRVRQCELGVQQAGSRLPAKNARINQARRTRAQWSGWTSTPFSAHDNSPHVPPPDGAAKVRRAVSTCPAVGARISIGLLEKNDGTYPIWRN